jgi:uncharacterized membrane protein
MITLDAIYLNAFRGFYNHQILLVQGVDVNFKILPAILTYVSLVFVLYYFIIREKKSVKDAFLLGVVIYSVFELTNMTIFNKWKMSSVILDTLWGGTLFAITTWATYRI